jgi:hypothetical protein
LSLLGSGKINIFVKNLTGEVITLTVDQSDLVQDVKAEIEKENWTACISAEIDLRRKAN